MCMCMYVAEFLVMSLVLHIPIAKYIFEIYLGTIYILQEVKTEKKLWNV